MLWLGYYAMARILCYGKHNNNMEETEVKKLKINLSKVTQAPLTFKWGKRIGHPCVLEGRNSSNLWHTIFFTCLPSTMKGKELTVSSGSHQTTHPVLTFAVKKGFQWWKSLEGFKQWTAPSVADGRRSIIDSTLQVTAWLSLIICRSIE